MTCSLAIHLSIVSATATYICIRPLIILCGSAAILFWVGIRLQGLTVVSATHEVAKTLFIVVAISLSVSA